MEVRQMLVSSRKPEALTDRQTLRASAMTDRSHLKELRVIRHEVLSCHERLLRATNTESDALHILVAHRPSIDDTLETAQLAETLLGRNERVVLLALRHM